MLKPFRYWRDSLFLVCCLLYAANRWGIRPRVRHGFFHDHFNDLLLMPAALPPLLWLQRKVRLRRDDRGPTWGEIMLYLVVWSILFEAIAPHILRSATGDPYDVVAYAVGGVFAGFWWHRGNRDFPLKES